MLKSNDPGHFFQTDAALLNAERRAAKASNKHGSPISLLSTLLAVLPDPSSPTRVYIAGGDGWTRRVALEVRDKPHSYKGHVAPVCALALNAVQGVLFTGSWDKSINAYSTESRAIQQTFLGHSDFVKSLLHVPSPRHAGGLLLSGSSDATIIIWDAGTGERLNTLKGHNRAVLTLALDPVASDAETAVVYSGGSERDIKRWEVPYADPGAARASGETIMEHDTSVYMIKFQGEDADMWTASADNTVRRIDVRNELKANGASRSDTVLKHPDVVYDVVVEPRGRWVVTACRDEEVRVWDISSGKLYHVYDGHLGGVTGLTIIGSRGDAVASISLDGTVRQWSLKPEDLRKAVEEKKLQKEGDQKEVEEKTQEGLLTLEEERELAELMEDD